MPQLGKRYNCQSCGSIVLCCTQGAGHVRCCGTAMELRQAKSLPSSD